MSQAISAQLWAASNSAPRWLRLASAAGGAVLLHACWEWLRRLARPAFHAPLRRQAPLPRRLRVAIIGAGVGGSSLACWLRDLYGDDLDLTVITDGPVGGRVAFVRAADGRQYEAGATLISELNEYMCGFMRRFGLREKHFKGVDIPVGVFNGERCWAFRGRHPESAPWKSRRLAGLQTALRLIRRYGLSNLRRMKGLMKHRAAPNFDPLYARLAAGEAFATPEALVEALGRECPALLSQRATGWLTAPAPQGGGLSAEVVHELIGGGMRANYGGQSCDDLHALVGMVSVAGGLASRCFGIVGGNRQVPDRLLEQARPDRLLVSTTARAIRPAGDALTGGWEVAFEAGSAGEAMKGAGSPAPAASTSTQEAAGPFDVVALAHPLERSCVRVEGASAAAQGAAAVVEGCHRAPFRRCVTHFLRGALRHSCFDKGGDDAEDPPLAVLTQAGAAVPFYSIGLQLPVDVAEKSEARRLVDAALRGDVATFKVFAPERLADKQLDAFFEHREGPCEVLDWYAYPQYSVPQPLRPFVLDGDGGSLLYLNAIEQAASAMEMSAVSARNAANLVVRLADGRVRAESSNHVG